MSIANWLEGTLLDAVFNAATYTGPTGGTAYLKLHTGGPGEAGTLNPSAETTRKALTFGAASGGSVVSDTAQSWTAWSAGAETITDVSIWDAASAGNCLWYGTLTASKSVQNDDTLTFASGAITVSLD